MTKFILVGGYPQKASDGGKSFCEELTKGLAEPIKILDCLFARAEENWEKAYGQDKEFFSANLPGKQVQVVLAQKETFVKQIREADAIYVRGGATRTLKEILNSIPGWVEAIAGKPFAGSSAGADALSRHYYNLDTLELEDGLGLVDVKMIPHWNSDYNAPNIDWEDAKHRLQQYGGEFPVLTLAEGEFVVRETKMMR